MTAYHGKSVIVLTVGFVLLMAVAVLGQNNTCPGKVGGWLYDWAKIAGLGAEAEEDDFTNPIPRFYYYTVCSVNNMCKSATGGSPAVCMKDRDSTYYSLGTVESANVSVLPPAFGGAGNGFTLHFSNGWQGSQTYIYVTCEEERGGGTFSFLQGNWTSKVFELQFDSKLGCPVVGPSPPPPPVYSQCCAYSLASNPSVTRRLCAWATCPSLLSEGYKLVDKWSVSSCVDCYA